MDDFLNFILWLIVVVVVGSIVYFGVGVILLAIVGDDTKVSPIISLAIFVFIVFVANVIIDKIFPKKKG